MPDNLISFETQAGEPYLSGDMKIIPFSQALTIRIPFFNGGFIWNRPASILTVTADGREQVLPIHDITRLTQIGLIGSGAIGSLIIWLIFRTIRKGKE